MAKKRNATKPQGTLSVEDVVNFHLRMWDLRDAIATGDLRKIDAAYMRLWDVIPNTTTNTGAKTQARNIRRKREETQQAAQQPDRRLEDLTLAEQEHLLTRLAGFVSQIDEQDAQHLACRPLTEFDNLSDEEQIAHLRELWN